MVMSNKPLSNVVFVVEGSANLSSYYEQIKATYICPTLEYFFGASLNDSDVGFEKLANSTLFAVVGFNTYDSEPNSSTTSKGSTALPNKLLQWIDELDFSAGVSPCSNIGEGLASALQCFDDLDFIRQQADLNRTNNITNHCILICNSSAYALPTNESFTYNGLLVDQLINLFNERNISLNIFSPRKIPFLFKLFEKGGGDLKTVFSKNFAKDARHLILLKGYSLQEYPQVPIQLKTNVQQSIQPNSNTLSNEAQNKPTSSPSGPQKRPLSPATASQGGPPTTIPALNPGQGVNQPIRGAPPIHSVNHAFNNHPGKAATPDTIMKPNRGASPVSRQNWNQSLTLSPGAPTPPINSPTSNNQISGLTNQLNIRPNTPSLQLNNMNQQQNLPVNVQVQQPNPNVINQQQQNLPKATNGNVNVRPPITVQSQQHQPTRQPINNNFNNQQTTQIIQNRASPHQSNMQQPINSQINQNIRPILNSNPNINQIIDNTQNLQGTQVSSQQQLQKPPQFQDPQNTNSQSQQPIQSLTHRESRRIWNGLFDFKNSNGLECQILSNLNPSTNETEVKADDWPERLNLQFISKNMIAKQYTVLQKSSAVIILQFNKTRQEEYQKLVKLMSTNCVGIIILQNSRFRVIVVFYYSNKQAFTGFIPNDQEGFLRAIREEQARQKNKQITNQQNQISSNMQPVNQIDSNNTTQIQQNISNQQANTQQINQPINQQNITNHNITGQQHQAMNQNFFNVQQQQHIQGNIQSQINQQNVNNLNNNPGLRTVTMQQQQLNQPANNSNQMHNQQINVHPQNPQQQNILLNKALNNSQIILNNQQQNVQLKTPQQVQQIRQKATQFQTHFVDQQNHQQGQSQNQIPQQQPNMVRQQLHHHIQQQHQAKLQNIQQQNVSNVSNTHLRHLLQQQQIRGQTPIRLIMAPQQMQLQPQQIQQQQMQTNIQPQQTQWNDGSMNDIL